MNDVDFPVASVLDGIDAAAEAGLPVKVNAVVKRGVNDDGPRRPGTTTFAAPAHVIRFIEFMDVGATNGWRLDDVVPAAEIVEHDRRTSSRSSRSRPAYRGEVARRWRYRDGAGRDRRDRVRHAAVLRRLHPRPHLGGGEAVHVPVRGARHRPPRAAAVGCDRRRGARAIAVGLGTAQGPLLGAAQPSRQRRCRRSRCPTSAAEPSPTPSPSARSRTMSAPRRSAPSRAVRRRSGRCVVGSGSSRAKDPVRSWWSTPSTTSVASPSSTRNTSSCPRSVSSCSGMLSPGGSSTTLSPNDSTPSDRRTSTHLS